MVCPHDAATAFLHGQTRLGAVQRLNLALLVGAQQDGLLGRIQIQADDIFQLLGELEIDAELEKCVPDVASIHGRARCGATAAANRILCRPL
jgi:hypothetical protein